MLNRQTVETVQVQMILRLRWIILLASVVFVATIEVIEHQELELHLAREFLIYGLVMPICTWLLLTLLARQMARQVVLAKNLEEHRQISRQLAHYQDSDELARFMTRLPGTLMPVNRVTLFQYNHLKAEMEFADEWNSDGRAVTATDYTPRTANTQYAWQLGQSSSLHQACDCPLFTGLPNEPQTKHICLPLVHDSVLVGLLRLRCQPDQTLSAAHKDFLNSISSQLALALALSIARPHQVREAQRTERRRVAYELHDSLAQEIGYLHLGIDRLADDERLKNTEWLQTELDRLRDVASNAYLQVRNNLELLQKPGEADFVQAVESYIRSIESQVAYHIEFRTSGTAIPLEPSISRQVIGVIQEGLNNVHKHAHAQCVQIDLRWLPQRLNITVADDGVGFDLAAVPNSGHYGLAMLRERAQDLRGELQITSGIGTGTTLQFEIPLRT